ncbi:hypothetical protein BGZ80_007021 [Entomortierella chlamydospora]|uniref:Uncharacterized protein n=1 Tax=Entomortierella chlamydospora TaxID=101097 RepID=A0A9P6SSX4_9FUNG|nr:hypothetical protein BGZ79_003330 [Entomortierella chlamydospora]KAF9997381.1 hypothetical protein BGZ80_007021 [Entomortierella chlamydospora]
MAPKAPWLYPVQGVAYFLSNPGLWPRVILPFIILLLATIALMVLAFVFLLPIQADFLVRHSWPHWLAYAAAVLFTLLEAALGSLITYLALMPFWEDALFDAVLRSRKLGYVVDSAHGDYRTCLNGVAASLYTILFQSIVLLFFQIVSLVLLLPLHVIPVAGTIIYCYLNGWVLSFSKRIHYDVELCKMRKYGWKHRNEFCEFGAVAVFLEMTPVLNLLFFWTNVVGTALWVADEIEEARRQDRLARSVAGQGHSGSHYVTFHPYDSALPGLPSEPLLGGHSYDSYGANSPQYQPPPYQVQQYNQQQQQQYQQQ